VESQLERLVGSCVEEVAELHDYAQLYFEAGAILTVYGHYTVSDENISALQGADLERVEETYEHVALGFSMGKYLRIALRDEAYSGPEALVLRVYGRPTIVWN